MVRSRTALAAAPTSGYGAAMQSFVDKVAVVTGAGSGIGRELAIQLASRGAHLALCDLDATGLGETAERCLAQDRPSGPARVSQSVCDVTDEEQLEQFRDRSLAGLETESVNLLFNNAGIGMVESFIHGDRAIWEKTFDVCWQGVYLSSRVFVPLVVASDEGHVVNVSSINGFWASLGPSRTHTSYAAAKFAVKGFSEALIAEFRMHAPHVGVSVVMPGHIGTGISVNSRVIATGDPTVATQPEVAERAAAFRNEAPTSAATAATTILDGVLAGQWRILIGEDAVLLDQMVRDDPEGAYEPEFIDRLHEAGVLRTLVQ